MTQATQTEAQRLAAGLDCMGHEGCAKAAAELRRLDAAEQAHARELRAYRTTVENLEKQLVAEAARTAEQKLRANQLEQQHAMQSKMHAQANARVAELEAQLEAIGAGGVEPLRKPVQPTRSANELTDADIDAVFDSMQDGAQGFLKSWGYRQFARALLATHPTPQGLDADMFWDADDPERCESSINNVVVEVDSYRGLKAGDIVTIQRAARLPDLEVRVTQVPDAEGNGDLEWDVIDAAQAKQGAEA